jgi:mTERF domain-containing protein
MAVRNGHSTSRAAPAAEAAPPSAALPAAAPPAAPPAAGDDASVQEVTAWFCTTYGIPYRSRVAAKVRRAAAALLAAEPSAGGVDLARDVAPKAELLEALSPGLGWRVFARYPEEFIHPDAADLWRIMAAYLYTAGYTPARISALFRRHACLFARTVRDPGNLKALFDWLRDLGLDQAGVARLIDKHPLILQADVEGALKPRLAYLQSLGLAPEAAVAVVRRHPSLLSVSSAALQERVDYLRGLGLTRREVARLCAAQAPVLACSVADKLAPLVALLQEELGCQGEALRRVLARSGLLSRAPDTVRARAAAWRALGLDGEALLGALRRFPRLLLYPIDEPKYRRKIAFLREELGVAPAALAAFPQFISYSLPRRIAPRVAAARALAGVTPTLQALTRTDAAFCRAHGLAPERYAAFLEEWPTTDEAQRWADDADDETPKSKP